MRRKRMPKNHGYDGYKDEHWLVAQTKERGFQDLCMKCAKNCKVLGGANSTFLCTACVPLK